MLLVQNPELLEDPVELVRKLRELKAEMDNIVEGVFGNEMKIQKARDSSFMTFMNTCAEVPISMASYCDVMLKKEFKALNEAEIESKLSDIVALFCCLHGRDIFIKSYTKKLAERLLNKTLLSQEAEELMLQKLKVECGVNTVSKISKMFADIELSKGLMVGFKQSKGTSIAGVVFEAEILTNGSWPQDKNPPPCNLPYAMKEC